MNLPFRKRSGTQPNPIIPEMNGPVQQNTPKSTPYWGRIALLIVAVLAVLVGLAAGGTWLYNKTAHQPAATVASTKQPTQPSQPATSSKPKASSSQTANTGAASSSNSSASASPTPQSTANPQTGPGTAHLSNTGPGDTVALFVGATIVSAVGYNIFLRKRVN